MVVSWPECIVVWHRWPSVAGRVNPWRPAQVFLDTESAHLYVAECVLSGSVVEIAITRCLTVQTMVGPFNL